MGRLGLRLTCRVRALMTGRYLDVEMMAEHGVTVRTLVRVRKLNTPLEVGIGIVNFGMMPVQIAVSILLLHGAKASLLKI